MIFGELASHDAAGAILAHGVRGEGVSFSKGRRLSEDDCRQLVASGIESVIAARMEPGDIDENAAAARLAEAIGPDHLTFSTPATGRVNLHAAVAGLFRADRATIDRFNRIDPAITLATLPDHASVQPGDMVATIKIIPLAVPGEAVERAAAVLAGADALLVKPFRARRVALVATVLPSLKPSVMDKTRLLLEHRLAPSGSTLIGETRVAHKTESLAAVLAPAARENELVVVFGASAVSDAGDVIPAAIRKAGGHVEQVGMPVDPGNLLVLGRIGETPVIGAPGCARSPKENGFDWVLARILAGEAPGAYDVTGMGVGGLLMEIPTRPQPREMKGEHKAAADSAGAVVAIVLAAGQARRMGADGRHKLLAEFDGVPLVRKSVMAALAAAPAKVVVVTGHRASEIEAAVAGLPVAIVRNPLYREGMSTSLIAGLDAAGADCSGVLVHLADMPRVEPEDLRRLMAAFTAAGGNAVVRAVSNGKRGNPVILPRSTFAAVGRLEGDVGARQIIETAGLDIIDVEIGPAAHLDVDTPEAVANAGGMLKE
ncbi:NTP transferase domain-containing protein [Mycoplana dimorpha]|uniref:Molybdopterin molybdochelatase /molybdenum cofactor cytidylyltransferase n=1 Tax=Mycoplana dimorpha TaxID=28320 RepID=A0A2T5AU09_MYCDI|nr:molybdopterin-binding/glycosyltransferase family 2 protein [Mycoplana dimorpha]PTM90216.1 molybdopterin molybdochelatase /molybdenum cofactor cytidylyltransferase [Mycoplana dimorpha]